MNSLNNKLTLPDYDIIFPVNRIVYSTRFSINSALSQTVIYKNFIVTIDTKDDLLFLEIKDKLKNIARVKIIRTYGNGPAFARNTAISLSEASFLAFLDSDDIWHRKKMELQLNSIIENNANFSFSSYTATNAKITKLKFNVSYFFKPNKLTFLFCNPIANSSVVIEKNLLLKNKGYVDIPSRNDFATWMRVFSDKNLSLDITNKNLCLIPKNDGSVSKSKGIISLYIAYNVNFKKFNSLVALVIFCAYQPFSKFVRKLNLFFRKKLTLQEINKNFLN